MRILFLDCFSGISGDMTLAALVDAGADREYIEQELAKIKIEPFTLEWKRVNKRGISALKLTVILDPDAMPKHHRHYSDIVDLIVRSGFSTQVTAISLAIFEKIGKAEAKIHDLPLEKIHFHEVGAIDSIVDIIGVALAVDSLAVDRIICTPVPLGSGTIHMDHGIYPIPAPATLEMMKGLPIVPTAYALEMTTPTGAGIVSSVVDEFAAGLPPIILESIGYGAGTRDLPNQPNVLRVIIGTTEASLSQWKVQHELIAQTQEEPSQHHHHPDRNEQLNKHADSHSHTHDHSHPHDNSHSHEQEATRKRHLRTLHEHQAPYILETNHDH